MLELAAELPDVHLGGTLDGLPFHGDATHLINIGYLRYGRLLARTLKDIVVDGLEPEWIRPLSAIVRGKLVRIRFSVPVAPLVIDVTNLAQTTGAGFKVTSSTGTSTITNVYVENGDTVVLALAEAPGTGVQVRCGLDYLGAGLTINNGATHNLRDSSTATFRKAGVDYPILNVAPHFAIPAITLDAGA